MIWGGLGAGALAVYGLFLLCALVVIAPKVPLRWSLLAFLVIAHLNLSGNDIASASQVGVGNAIKNVVLPAVLLLRTGFGGLRLYWRNRIFWLWIAFALYSAVTWLWSPFPIPGLKALGYLFAYTASFLVFSSAFRQDEEGTFQAFSRSIPLALGLAIVQTYLLGGSFGGADSTRFTSFIAPQSFGLFLALAVGILFADAFRDGGSVAGLLWVPVLALAAVLNGSRAGIVGIALLVGWSFVTWTLHGRTFHRLVVAIAVANVVVWLSVGIFVFAAQNKASTPSSDVSRVEQLVQLVTGEISPSEIGTLRFRLQMYRTIWGLIKEKPGRELVFGSGLSSVGEIVADGYYSYRNFDWLTVDANRLAHNEYLRITYELGTFGLSLFALFYLGILVGLARKAFLHRSAESLMLLGSVLVLMIFLGFENLMAAAVQPSGVAISLIIAQAATVGLRLPSAERAVTAVEEPVGPTAP